MTNEVAVQALPAVNRVIRSIEIVDVDYKSPFPWARYLDDRQALVIVLESGWTLVFMDDCGQSCCENRYMHTDDDLTALVGETLVSVRHGGGNEEGEMDACVVEAEFVHIQTNRDSVVIGTYNSHNGYYGGLDLAMTVLDPEGNVVVNRTSLTDAE